MPALTPANLWLYAAQVALLTTALALVLAALGRPSPGFRLAACRAVFLLVLLLPFQSFLRASAGSAGGDDGVPAVVIAGLDRAEARAAAGWPWGAWLAGLAAAGAGLRGVWLLVGLGRLVRASRRPGPCIQPDEVRALQTALGTAAQVRWRAGGGQPVTFGLWPPVVLLPAELADAPPAHRRAVLCHELLHVKRRDWPWLLAEEAVLTLFWFHPGVWWLVRELQMAREEVVDRLAVAVLGERRAYLDALFASAAAPQAAPLFAGFLRRRQLTRRIVSLTQEVPMSPARILAGTLTLSATLGAGAGVALAALPLAPMPQAAPPTAGVRTTAAPDAPAAQGAQPPLAVTEKTEIVFPSAAAHPELAGVVITVFANVDAAGAVTSARLGSLSMRTLNGNVGAHGVADLGSTLDRVLRTAAPGGAATPLVSDVEGVKASLKAMAAAATDAVQRWRVESPETHPALVSIDVRFEPRASRASAGGARPLLGYGARNQGGRGGSGFSVQVDGPPRDGEPGAPAGPAPLRVGGNIAPPTKVVHVNPVYPEEAKTAGIQGVVILEATVDGEGVPVDMRVLRSIPGLDEAAMDAVRQWRYAPTLLNGAPVPVIMTVTINFTLSQ